MVMGMWKVMEGCTAAEMRSAVKKRSWDLIMSAIGACIQLEQKLKELGISNEQIKQAQNV